MNKSVFWSNHPQDADHGGECEVSIGDVKTHPVGRVERSPLPGAQNFVQTERIDRKIIGDTTDMAHMCRAGRGSYG